MPEKKTPKEASKLFENIMKASVTSKKIEKKERPKTKPKPKK